MSLDLSLHNTILEYEDLWKLGTLPPKKKEANPNTMF